MLHTVFVIIFVQNRTLSIVRHHFRSTYFISNLSSSMIAGEIPSPAKTMEIPELANRKMVWPSYFPPHKYIINIKQLQEWTILLYCIKKDSKCRF